MITTQEVIAYMMIIMNFMSARAFDKYKNGIFRKMKATKSLKIPDNLPKNVKMFLKGWRSAGGSYTNYDEQDNHDFLGLDTYCHITSPIRRLVDLLNLLQMMKNLNIIRDNGHQKNKSHILTLQCVLSGRFKVIVNCFIWLIRTMNSLMNIIKDTYLTVWNEMMVYTSIWCICLS